MFKRFIKYKKFIPSKLRRFLRKIYFNRVIAYFENLIFFNRVKFSNLEINDKDEIIECGFVGLTAGVSPNIEFVKNTSLETDRGILVNEFMQTNIPDIYAIGDCAQFISIKTPIVI